ncbi:TPA: hypothetical protein ACP62L_005016, partial [Escherichia coli]
MYNGIVVRASSLVVITDEGLLRQIGSDWGLRANDAKNHANSVSSLFILKLIGTAFTATSVVMVGLR